MILIIETAYKKNTLHFFEFVKPIMDILTDAGITFTVKHYKELAAKDIEEAEKFIICGNGLQDTAVFDDVKRFAWLKTTRKPVLGICAGMQIIGKVHGGKIKPRVHIGVSRLQFLEPDPLIRRMSKYDVYELHNYMVTVPTGFTELAETYIPMAFRKNDAPVYGVMFHPEVMNKELIRAFGEM